MTVMALAPRSSVDHIRWPGRGASEDARTIRDRVAAAFQHLLSSHSTGASLKEADLALTELEHEAAEDGWDSKDGRAINPVSVAASRRFLALMPTTFPAPHVSVDPDGEVAFDWQSDRGWGFSISFSPDQTVSYAGLFGFARSRGVEYFADEIPGTVIEGLRRALGGR
jgi:hypothetical protein